MKQFLATQAPLKKMLTMSALGLVLASHSGFAQNSGQAADTTGTGGSGMETAWQATFNEVDANDNNAADWQEIETTYNTQLQEAGWDKQQVMDRFDRNSDGVIDDPEYVFFMTGLENAQRTAATGGQQNQNQMNTQDEQSEITQQQSQQQSQSQNQQGEQAQDMVVLQEEEREELQPDVVGLRDQSDEEMQQTQQDAVAQGNQQNQQRQQDAMAQNVQSQQGQQGQQNQQASNPQGQQSPQGDVVTLVAVTTVQEVPIADIEDRQVVNLQGEQIGEVEDVVVSQDGTKTGLVVSVGGFWNIGDKEIYVDLDDVAIRADQVIWETMASEEELENLPEYNEKDYVSMR